MGILGHDEPSAETAVRNSLAAADRRRRARGAGQRMWQAAPPVAGAALCVAAASYFARWPVTVPLIAIGAGAVGLLLVLVLGRRPRAVGDATAMAIDRDAGLEGELRSAYWFATRIPGEPWAEFHLATAAARLRGIDWAALYPPFRAPRAASATAALGLAAIVLAMAIPASVGSDPDVEASSARARVGDLAAAAEPLPPELQQRLEELLAAVERGDLARAGSLAGDPALARFLQGLTHLRDRELLEALSRALSAETTPGTTSAAAMQALAERTRRAAEAPPLAGEMQSAFQKLATELDLASADKAARADAAAPDGSPEARGEGPGADGAMDQVSIEFARGTDAGGGQGIIMMPGEDGTDGAGSPGAGIGGAGSAGAGEPAAKTETAAALRREIIEAGEDHAGANVESDVRRKTEHGDAALAYTRSATRTFDPTRAVAPPPLPETRRTGVQSYFLRTP